MKKLISIPILFFLVYNGFAQAAYYKGEWTVKDKTDLFTCISKIEIQKDGTAKGTFIWKYISIDSNNAELVQLYKGKKGRSGIEYTEGRFNANTNDLFLSTSKLEDPNQIIGLTKYYIKLSADKEIIYGTTTNLSDEEPGMFYAAKMNGSAEKEFFTLQNKIKKE